MTDANINAIIVGLTTAVPAMLVTVLAAYRASRKTAEIYTKVDGNLSTALLKLEAMEKTLRDAGINLPTKTVNGAPLGPTQPPSTKP